MRAPMWLAALAALLLAGCNQPQSPSGAAPPPQAYPPQMTPAPNVPGNPDRGRGLFFAAGCAGCHTINGVAGATGVAGPNLTNVTVRPTIAGQNIPNTPGNMVRWLMDPPALKPGTAMPNLSLSRGDAQDLAAYLYSLPESR